MLADQLPQRRSILVLPGSQPRFFAKAASSTADGVVLDLEDSVAPAARETARRAIIAALTAHDWSGKYRTVRVNAMSTPWCYQDVIAVVEGAGAWLDALVLPKVNHPHELIVLATLLDQIEAAHGLTRPILIEAQIETAAGLAQVEAIAGSSPRLAALVFGPGDLAASLGMPVLGIGTEDASYPGHLWHAHLVRIVVAARAAGLQAVDGPYGAFSDLAGLQSSAHRSRQLGYDGKWAIHPRQLDTINAAFSPTTAERARAQALLAAYEASEAAGHGALRHGGEMVDRASVAMARRVLGRKI